MENLRNKTNEQRQGGKTNQKNTDSTREKKLMVTRGEVGGKMGETGEGD